MNDIYLFDSVLKDLFVNHREFVLFTLDVLLLSEYDAEDNPLVFEEIDDLVFCCYVKTGSLRKKYGNKKYKESIEFLLSKNFMFKADSSSGSYYLVNDFCCFVDNGSCFETPFPRYLFYESIS